MQTERCQEIAKKVGKKTETTAREAALCNISSLEEINEAWLDGVKINLHSLIRCNPLGAILTPLKLLK